MNAWILVVGAAAGISGIVANYYKLKYYNEGLEINHIQFLSFTQLNKARKKENNIRFLPRLTILFRLLLLNWIFIAFAIILVVIKIIFL